MVSEGDPLGDRLEVANVLARLVFAGALQRDDVTEIWHDLAGLGLACIRST